MNSHKNARTTLAARKWLDRFDEFGEEGLADHSSRPDRTRTTINDELRARIERLRRGRMPMRAIAGVVGHSVATISRVLAAAGLSSLQALDPAKPVVRYEHAAPGELLHMDTKKLGCIERPSHRITGDRRDASRGAGWEVAHVAIDDHSRAGFVQMHADERKDSAVAFLKAAVAHYAAIGVRIKRLITDNGSAYRSRLFARTCEALGIKHTFTRPYRPQTNGKAERFIQTCLREWAYARSYANSTERTSWLPAFLSYYNSRRPHSALGYKPPASRLGGNNLLQLNS